MDTELSAPQTTFRAVTISGFQTGVLDISLRDRRILSVPTQLGCRVGCTFCLSSRTPLVRNLTTDEMVLMVQTCLLADLPDGRPIELSFTGEGESVMNWRKANDLCLRLPSFSKDFTSVRYCFSGLGAPELLHKLDAGDYPMRLQFSLHAARQAVRDRLIPRSAPLCEILAALERAAGRFIQIDLNVVLQDGVNDSPEDLAALCNWGDLAWTIVLNPLLNENAAPPAVRSKDFELALRAAGRRVKLYGKVGASINQRAVYPLLTAQRLR